jgi:Tol biopolymer transport system component
MRLPQTTRYLGVAAAALALACADDAGCDTSNPLMPTCIDPAADAAYPEPAIVFMSNRDGPYQIYTMNSDGSGVRRLTFDGNDVHPRWSPDGTKIVFASTREGATREIYVMNADGSELRRLTQLGNTPGHPAWSPDGTKIAFGAVRGGGDWDIYVMNADGSDVRRLTTTESQTRPRWSPDGTRIVFEWAQNSTTCCHRIGVMNADGSGKQIITDAYMDMEPEWSPDGSRIAYVATRLFEGTAMGYLVLGVMNADGTDQRLLGSNTIGARGIEWSRSTGRIYFIRTSYINSVRPDGSGEGRITAVLSGVPIHDMAVHAR